jgi:hypothetical protein
MLASVWQAIVAFLVWLSTDPAAIDLERPRAFAAVQVARATLLADRPGPAPPGPAPVACDCGETCVRGIWKPDGRVQQTCRCPCKRCAAERAKAGLPADCKSGNCSVSSSAGR